MTDSSGNNNQVKFSPDSNLFPRYNTWGGSIFGSWWLLYGYQPWIQQYFLQDDSAFSKMNNNVPFFISGMAHYEVDTDYSFFTPSSLTINNTFYDTMTNNFLRLKIEDYGINYVGNPIIDVSSNTQVIQAGFINPDFSLTIPNNNQNNQPADGYDTTNCTQLNWLIFISGILNRFGIYNYPLYLLGEQFWKKDHINLACRVHNFDLDPNNNITLSLVDICTGEEKFRIINGDGSDDNDQNPYLLNSVRRVNNGVADKGSSNLTLEEKMQINTALPCEVWNYYILDYYVENLKNAVALNNGLPVFSDLTTDFLLESIGDPLIDGVNGYAVLGGCRLLAVDNVVNNGNYLLSSIFGTLLPFNQYQYNIYDFEHSTYLPPNALNYQNLKTVLKLIGITFLTYEAVKITRRNFKLSFY
jgi:hypothetical protein